MSASERVAIEVSAKPESCSATALVPAMNGRCRCFPSMTQMGLSDRLGSSMASGLYS